MSDKLKLVIDDAVYENERIFGDFGQIFTYPGREIDEAKLADCDILIVRSRTKIGADLLAESKVNFVGSTVAGLDHIDENYLHQNHIKFASAQGCNAMAVAEFVISTMVNLAADFGFELRQKTLGIIGVGNVGTRLAAKAKMLGIKTLLNDPLRQIAENLPDFVDLKTALGADIISFHTPLTFDGKYPSYHLLAGHNFQYIKPDAIIFNAARGGVIDEAIWAKRTTLANVIDCWENEPDINQTLQNSAYLATPHIAGHSVDAKFMGSFMIYQQLCSHLKITPDPKIANLINAPKTIISEPSLQKTLNKIYPFNQDDAAIRNLKNFEHYRRHYPLRREWHNFTTKISLPII